MRVTIDANRIRFEEVTKDIVRPIFNDEYVIDKCCSDYDVFTESTLDRFTHIGVYVDDKLVGVFYYDRISVIEIEAHMAFYASAKELVRDLTYLFAKHVFDSSIALRITVFAYDYRRTVINMLIKVGFRIEGVMRKCAIKNSVWYDKYALGILKGEL